MRTPAAALALLALAACQGPVVPSTPAVAQRACVVPAQLSPAPIEIAPPDEIVRDAPTVSHMLAIAWSPQWCADNAGDPAYADQCAADFGFVLHGLWPNGADGRHPRYCAPAPMIEATTVREHFCMTPSAELLQHEWAAHGTCGWDSPEAYFDQAAALWAAVTVPNLEPAADRPLTAGAVRDAFVAANPGLRREAIHIAVAERSRLREVRLCYDTAFAVAPCLGGLGAPDHARLALTPRRGEAPAAR